MNVGDGVGSTGRSWREVTGRRMDGREGMAVSDFVGQSYCDHCLVPVLVVSRWCE